MTHIRRRWNGVETRRLRELLRMTVPEFAAELGVSHQFVSEWEAGGVDAVPRQLHQSALDDTMNRCTPDQLNSFDNPDHEGLAYESRRVDLARWGLVVNVDRSEAELIVDIIAAVNTLIDKHRSAPTQPDLRQS